MLLYIMGEPITLIPSININFNGVGEELSKDNMTALNTVLSSCRNAISMAHSNAREAFRHQQEVQRFLTSNTVLTDNNNKTVDYGESNPKVNFTEIIFV